MSTSLLEDFPAYPDHGYSSSTLRKSSFVHDDFSISSTNNSKTLLSLHKVSDASGSVYSLDSAPVFATDEVLNNNSAFDGTNDESDVYVVKSSEREIENIDADTFYLQVSLATVRRL